MLHPSYSELMEIVNEDATNDTPVVNSRYSIVMATARRARQLVAGEEPLITTKIIKPLSIAVEELNRGQIKIVSAMDDDDEVLDAFMDTATEETEMEVQETIDIE
ncbi:MAG: DNA-directed RNA polymerase subunit omega [Lachnospiraceae bacterium]